MNMREIILQEMVNLLKEDLGAGSSQYYGKDYTKITGIGSPDEPFRFVGERVPYGEKPPMIAKFIKSNPNMSYLRNWFFVEIIVNTTPRLFLFYSDKENSYLAESEISYEKAKKIWDDETKRKNRLIQAYREDEKKDQEEATRKYGANFQSNFNKASSLLERKAFKINLSDSTFVSIQDIANKYRNSICFFNLWARYCGACESEMPAIKNYIDDYNQKNPNKKILYIGLFLVDEDQEDQMRLTSSEVPKNNPGNSVLYFSRYDILFRKVNKKYIEDITIPRSLLFVDGKFTNVYVGNLLYYGVDNFINTKPAAPAAQQAQPAAPAAPAAKPATPAPATPAPPAFKVGDRVSYPNAGIFTVAEVNGNKVTIKNKAGQTVEVDAKWLTKR